MLGIDRGSQSLARIHGGSSTRTRREPTAFLQEQGFPPAPHFSSYTARQARGPTVPPPAGVTAGSHGAKVPPGPGTTGQGCPGHRDRCSGSQRQAPSLGKPSPGGGGCCCCPGRGSGASAALCAQGAHSAPDAFSNLARLVRLRQRGRGVSALTLAKPRSRPRCEGAPRRWRRPGTPGPASRGPARARNRPELRAPTRAELGKPRLSSGHRQGAHLGSPSPDPKRSPTQITRPCISSINREPVWGEPTALQQCHPNAQKLVPAATFALQKLHR